MSIDFIIGMKVGIGETPDEASLAVLKQASQLKEKVNDSDLPESVLQKTVAKHTQQDYSIARYDGPEVEIDPEIEEARERLSARVKESIDRLATIERKYGKDELAYTYLRDEVRTKEIDKDTGCLTPFGYQFQIQTQESERIPEGMKRFYLMFDGNDMHYWNEKADYNDVTAHLHLMGRTLKESTRGKKRPEDKTRQDLVGRVTRTHGSAGDEFLVDIICKESDIMKITTRIMKEVYQTQIDKYLSSD